MSFYLTILDGAIYPTLPPWFGDERLHSSHRAALLFKNPGWYGKLEWVEKADNPDDNGKLHYWYPTNYIRNNK
jgi:hypothetical protein